MSGKSVFLSHRRDESCKPFAHMLERALTPHGYDVFLDVNDMRAGPWPEQLMHEIADRAHFLLLVTAGALDPCGDPQDWVRREFERAEQTGRNIVLVLAENVDLTTERDRCPECIRHVFDYQATRVAYDTLDRDLEVLLERFIAPHHAPDACDEHSTQPNNPPQRSIETLFKGREAALDELREKLDAGDDRAVGIVTAQLVHGLGGVGKTRLAIEFAWRNRQRYAALLFVKADAPDNLAAGLAGLCATLNVPERDATEQDVRVAAVRKWLSRNPGWLLILDNVDDQPAAVAAQELAESLAGGHLLITRRWTRFGRSVRKMELDVLDEDQAARYLIESTQDERRLTGSDDSDALELARRLDCLAVALEHAGAYIVTNRCSIADYRHEWEQNFEATAAWYDGLTLDYPRSMLAAWATTVEKLSDDARRLLEMLCWLATDPVPGFLLSDVRTAANQLGDYSMLKWDRIADTWQMHGVVQEVTRTRLSETASSHEGDDRGEEDAPESLHAALAAVNAYVPTRRRTMSAHGRCGMPCVRTSAD